MYPIIQKNQTEVIGICQVHYRYMLHKHIPFVPHDNHRISNGIGVYVISF